MVQFFQQQAQPTAAEMIGGAFSQGLQGGLSQSLESFYEKKKIMDQQKAIQNFISGASSEKSPVNPLTPKSPTANPFQERNNLIQNPQGTSQAQTSNFQQPEQIQSQGLKGYSYDQLMAASGNPIYGEIAKEELKRRSEVQKDIRKSEITRSDKFLNAIDDSREALQRSESSLAVMENALANRDLGFWSKNNLAKIPGFGGFVTPEGAVFNSAAKEFFLSDLERVMGRPNQFLEKVLSNAIPKIGTSNEANQTVLDFYKNAIDIQKQKVQIADQLDDYYRSRGLHPPGNMSRLVDEQLKLYVQKKEKELMEKYKTESALRKSPKGNVNVYDGQGKLTGTVHSAQIKDLPEGYYVK